MAGFLVGGEAADLVIIQMGGNDHRHPNEIPGRDYYHAYVELVEDVRESRGRRRGASTIPSGLLDGGVPGGRGGGGIGDIPGSRARAMYDHSPEKWDVKAEQPADLVIIQMGGNVALLSRPTSPGCGRTLHVRESRGRRRGASTIPSPGLLPCLRRVGRGHPLQLA
jgi:hypothetical protein